MSEIPGETNLHSGDPGRGPEAEENELQAWLEWFKHAGAAGADLAKLARMELSLALGDTKRIVLLGLLAIPLAVLTWLGLSVLIAWLCYIPTQSVSAAIGMFIGVQVVPLLLIAMSVKRYRKSWAFAATREHLKAFKEGAESAAKTTD
ncbi:MAG: hypothetical protein JKY26_02180 [Pseudomonas sp.]|nr:hypothetical protein [Pseudomonas sp.]